MHKKSGLKCDKANFRPISILPTISKACEAVIDARLLAHCTDNNIISERQAAYLKGGSTINQLLYILHQIYTAWGGHKVVQGIFLDIKGAFDKMWHKGLIAKLDQIGIEDNFLQLFASYLSGRKQIVVVDGIQSEVKNITSGCPQGSKLGPLLFIIYINDIIKDLECEILLFADDTTLIAIGQTKEETATMLNRDLQRIDIWAKRWKVTFNASKSKQIIFSKKKLQSLPIIFNQEEIKQVDTLKHLGVVLTRNLDWTEQVNFVCLKANRKLGVLRSVLGLSRQTLDILYKLTVRSQIDYGLIIYYNDLTQKQKTRLDQIQYKAGKIVSGALHLTNRVKLDNELGWESLQSRTNFLGLTLYQKIHILQTRPLLRQCMTKPKINYHDLRQKTTYPKHKYLNMKHKNSYFPYFTNLWNNTPERAIFDFEQFKIKLKERLKPKKFKFYKYGCKQGNKLITSLRVGRSLLNADCFSIGLAPSPECNCGAKSENSRHILLSCPLFETHRQTMLGLVEQQLSKFKKLNLRTKENILLFGYKPENNDFVKLNINITLAVQTFLLKTNRFER